MNKWKAITFLAASLGLAHTSLAGDNGLYLGASVGSVESTVNADVAKGLANDFDGDDAAYKVILGVRPIDWLAAEVNYLDLGKPDSAVFASDTTGVSGSAVLIATIIPSIEVFAKAGVVNWKSKITSGTSKLFDRDGTDPVYGGGLMVNVLSLTIRAEYEHFDIDEGSNLLSLGLTWTFL